MQNKTITICNKLGLHARAAAKLVHLASRYGCEINLYKGEQAVNAKSIMGVMLLGASFGTELVIQVEGEEEAQAMEDLVTLIQNRFGEAE